MAQSELKKPKYQPKNIYQVWPRKSGGKEDFINQLPAVRKLLAGGYTVAEIARIFELEVEEVSDVLQTKSP